MSTIFLAYDEKTKEIVVVKQYSKEALKLSGNLDMYKEDLQRHYQLQKHQVGEGILLIKDSFEDNINYYKVLEYSNCGDLQTFFINN